MSNAAKGRIVGFFLLVALAIFGFFVSRSSATLQFDTRELTSAINARPHEGALKVSNVLIESADTTLRVSFSFTGTNAGLPVQGEAIVIGTPGYGAVRRSFTFSTQNVQVVKLVATGTGSSTTLPTRNTKPQDLSSELGNAVATAFQKLRAHELHPEMVSSFAWLNAARVHNGTVIVEWNMVKTTIITTVVLVVAALIVLILIVNPDILFWMLFFWAMN